MNLFYVFDEETGRIVTTAVKTDSGYKCVYDNEPIALSPSQKIVEEDEAIALQQAADRKRYCKGPRESTAERFDEALNVLPPAKWQRMPGGESFYVSEPITSDLVDWHVRIGDKFYSIVESRFMSNAEIAKLCVL